MNSAPYDPETVEVGDIVQIPWVKSYQHGATMIVTKVNAKTFLATEIEGSYGGPITKEQAKTTHSHLYERKGQTWKMNKRTEGLRRPFNVEAELRRLG